MSFSEWLWLTWILGAGFGIGVFFYGGLWLTVGQITKTRYPGLLFLGSFTGRTLISILGFYLLMGHQLSNALVSVAGFLLARLVLVHVWRPVPSINDGEREELYHAVDS